MFIGLIYNFRSTIFVLIAKNRPMNAYTIQKAVLQHVMLATDLAMDFHVRHRPINAELHVRIAISYSRMRTVSSTTSLNRCRGNRAHSKAYVNNDTCANNVGNLSIHAVRDTTVGRRHQMKNAAKDAEAPTDGACLVISSPWRLTNSTLCYKNIEDLERIPAPLI